MNKKSFVIFGTMLLASGALAGCGSKGPKQIAMSFEEALEKINAATEAYDLTVNKESYKASSYNRVTSAVYHDTQYQTQAEEYDSWSGEIADRTYYDGFVEANTVDYEGEEGSYAEAFDDEHVAATYVNQYYYDDAGNIICVEKDDDAEAYIGSVYGPSYIEWWDYFYGHIDSKYAAYVGYYTMDYFDGWFFGNEICPNANAAYYLDAYNSYFDEEDGGEDEKANVTGDEEEDAYTEFDVVVDAWSDYTTVSVSIGYQYGVISDFISFSEDPAYDVNFYERDSYVAKFNTETGEVVAAGTSTDYFIFDSIYTGAAFSDEEEYDVYGYSYEYEYASVDDTYTGTKLATSNSWMTSFYDVYYKSATEFWFFTVTNGGIQSYCCNTTLTNAGGVSTPTACMVDGSSATSTVTTYDASTGAMSFAGSKTGYVYTFTHDDNGNLVVSYNNGESDVTETYYTSIPEAAE